MNIIELLSRLFGRKGELRRALQWDASGGGNRLKNWTAPSTNFASTIPAPLVRERARDAYRNNPWARRAVDSLVVNAIGAGIKPQLRLTDAELKRTADRAWTEWTDAADFGGRYDFYGLQQQALRAAAIDGEVLVRMVIAPENRVPLQLQVLPGEFLDSSRVDNQTLDGIEYDAAGQRRAYWLYRRHPAAAPDMVSTRVPAEEIIHLYAPIQPGVQRGTSWLAPGLLALRELQEFVEAALTHAKVGSLFSGFVQLPDGAPNPLAGSDGAPQLEPGSMVRLRAGETVEFSEPPDAGGATYEAFVRSQLRAIASALNMPYEILAGDVSQVTFASGRHSLLEFRRQLESIQHHLVVFQLCRPIWQAWVRLAVAAGVLPEADYAVRWIAPLPEMLDTGAETRAVIARIRAGLISRAEAVSLTGLDIEELDAEIASDNARADRLGLVLDSDPRRTAAQGQAQQAQQE